MSNVKHLKREKTSDSAQNGYKIKLANRSTYALIRRTKEKFLPLEHSHITAPKNSIKARTHFQPNHPKKIKIIFS